jgi:hypothetical protein
LVCAGAKNTHVAPNILAVIGGVVAVVVVGVVVEMDLTVGTVSSIGGVVTMSMTGTPDRLVIDVPLYRVVA